MKYLNKIDKFSERYLKIGGKALKLYQCQKDWAELIKDHEKLLINSPVDHAKSVLFGFVLPIFKICNNKDIRILFGSASPTVTANTSLNIRDEFETNNLLIEDFGPFYKQGNLWQAQQWTIERPGARGLRDPTFSAVTPGRKIEGVRGDCGILDDPIDIDSAESEATRGKILRWVQQTYMNRLEPGSPIYVMGTRWHPDDLYHSLVKMGFFPVSQRAEVDGFLLCPEKWTLEALAQRKSEIGSIAYDQKFNNNPQAIIGSKFRTTWLNFYEKTPKDGFTKKLIACDLAIGQKSTNDYYARVVLGLSRKNRIYLLEIMRGRLNFLEQQEDIIAAYNTWMPYKIIIENNNYQRSIIQQLMKDHLIPVVGVTNTENKLSRIESLAPYFENGTILIRHDMEDFITEFTNFPGAKFDQLDALELGVKQLISHELPSAEPEWLERGADSETYDNPFASRRRGWGGPNNETRRRR